MLGNVFLFGFLIREYEVIHILVCDCVGIWVIYFIGMARILFTCLKVD